MHHTDLTFQDTYTEPIEIHQQNDPEHDDQRENEWNLNLFRFHVNGSHVDLLDWKPVESIGNP